MKQLITFFTLAYLTSWFIWLPLYGPAIGVHHLPILPYHHALGGLGPMLAAIITSFIYKRDSIASFFRTALNLKNLLYTFIALLSPFILAVLAMYMQQLINGVPAHYAALLNNKEFPEFNLLLFFLYNLLFFGLGEEVGWRGFVLPRFQSKMNALSAATVLTVFWAVWHWPLFLYRPGYTSMDIAGAVGWVLSLFTGSVLLSWLYNATSGNVWVCAIFHATVDIPFTANLGGTNAINYLGMLITIWGIATLLLFGYKNLSKNNRVSQT